MLEQEMKIPVPSLAEVRLRLHRRGATLVQASALEDNWVLDDRDRTLAAAGRLLRVRRCAGRSVLTLKGPASFSAGVKSRTELETEVGDGETALEVLATLGLACVRRYQQRRETWTLAGVTVALDETPMGAFVELEGEAGGLGAAAAALDLDPRRAARGTYLDLWAAYRGEHPEAPLDMVFTPGGAPAPPDGAPP